MDTITHAKFHFNRLTLTLIFGVRASEPPRPGERVKRPGLIGFKEDSLSKAAGAGVFKPWFRASSCRLITQHVKIAG